MRACRMWLLTLLLASISASTIAITPGDQVSYQGVLRNAAGKPLSGDFDMLLAFFESETGGPSGEVLIDEPLASGTGP